jgi:hypothetical protein
MLFLWPGGNCIDEYTAAQYVPRDFYQVFCTFLSALHSTCFSRARGCPLRSYFATWAVTDMSPSMDDLPNIINLLFEH